MMDKELFKKDPRDYALTMVDEGLVPPEDMLQMALKWMSYDDVRGMSDANELSPRFLNEEDEDED